jgi:hypothetical protein
VFLKPKSIFKIFQHYIVFKFNDNFCLIIFQNARSEETNERVLGSLKAEKEELGAALNREQIQTLELKQQLAEAETRNMDLTKVKQNGLYFYFSAII